MNFNFHLRLTNHQPKGVQLVLEPWGTIHSLPSQNSAEIVFEMLEETGLDAPEIVWGEDAITVHCGRAGGIVEVVSAPNVSVNGQHSAALKVA